MSEAATRRDLARRGLIAAGAALGAAAAPAASRAFAQTEDTSDTDSELLVGLIGIEQTAVLAYETAAAAGALGPAAPIAKLFGTQEQEHADALIAALAEIGGKPLPAPRIEDVPGLTEATTAEDYLNFAVDLENQAIAAYLEANKLLGNGDLLKTSSQICANEGQHLVVLRQALGTDPIPGPLPSGSETA